MNNFYRCNLPKWVWFVCALAFWSQSSAAQEAIKIWEYSPYEVEVWCSLDSNLDLSDLAKSQFNKSLSDDLDRMFQAAWHTSVKSASPEMASRIARDIETLSLEDFTREELVLLVNKDSASTVKSTENAVEKISEFVILPQHKAKVDAEVAKAAIDPNSAVGGLLSKLKTMDGDLAAIMAGLEAKTIQAALVPRSAAKGTDKIARTITVLLPWQTDTLLRQHDKIFMVHVGQTSEGYYVQARELDCSLQFMGPTLRRETTSWSFVTRTATAAIARAFAPVARVEDATAKTASLRLKAGGLIMDDDNPAKVLPGDLMQPVVRREGGSGVPSVLEALHWTYAAIIASDGVKMKANVYAYSGGPGLQGRNNRRTQRLLLRVRPTEPETEIQISVKSSGKPQGGCAVYERDLITDKFTLLGKTDWRGRFAIPAPSKTGAILPDEIYKAKTVAEKAAKEAAAAAAAAAEVSVKPTEQEETEGDEADAPKTAPKPAAPAPTTPAPAPAPVDYEQHLVQLRQPLVQLYVKSGDVVLARLPLVPGVSPLEIAELADDSRRLEAEAFIRGFQGEVLDLIGLRTLLSTRVRKLLQQGKKTEAEKVMAELRGLKDYSAMVETLDKLQRKLLDDSLGPVSMGAKSRIDKMLQTTREMMQKYLQNDLVRDAETAVSRGSVPEEEVSVPEGKATSSATPSAPAENK